MTFSSFTYKYVLLIICIGIVRILMSCNKKKLRRRRKLKIHFKSGFKWWENLIRGCKKPTNVSTVQCSRSYHFYAPQLLTAIVNRRLYSSRVCSKMLLYDKFDVVPRVMKFYALTNILHLKYSSVAGKRFGTNFFS